MPSPRHDALIRMFTARPQLAVEILRDLMGVELPDTPLIQLEKGTFNTRPSDDIEATWSSAWGHRKRPRTASSLRSSRTNPRSPGSSPATPPRCGCW
ncbi:hypothetical protein ACTMTI_28470 [Nonomuraea sp. H19]|uniref:hypothetical protein n=1 Tax=Nonomuraea sp. H19 TaxID=3452206 RepID=UPI003F895F98